jgi:hypothetical protein
MTAPRRPTGRPAFWLCAFLLVCAAGGSACMGSDALRSDSGNMPPATGGTTPAPQLELQFLDTPIQVLPREERRITLKVWPPSAHTVRFALLAGDAPGAVSPLDAALDRSEVVSDASGLASVVLTAPSAASDFSLRAEVGSTWIVTAISVVPGALVNLAVHPNYLGHRAVSEWTASVHVGVACEDFRDGTIPDSALLVRGAGDAPLRLEDVPAASKLAVTLRADSFARGCTTLNQPAPGTDTEVTVTVNDLPILLSETSLQVSLGLDAKDPAFNTEFDAALAAVQLAMRNEAPSDVSAVLGDMQASLNSGSALKFAEAREQAGWDESLSLALGRGADTRLADAVARYARAGRAPLFSSQAFEGRLSGNGAGDVPNFEIERVAGVSAQQLALAVEAGAWSVDSTDALSFSASLSWPAAALLAGLSEAAASAETGASDVPAAFAQILSCARVAETLAADSDTAGALLAVCPANCLESTCEDALTRMWDRARSASDSLKTSMEVLATGTARVGAERQVVSLDGVWVGRLTREEWAAQSGGSLKGIEPR